MAFCGSLFLFDGIFIKRWETVRFDFAENSVKSITRHAATFMQYGCPLCHNFAHSEQFPSKVGI